MPSESIQSEECARLAPKRKVSLCSKMFPLTISRFLRKTKRKKKKKLLHKSFATHRRISAALQASWGRQWEPSRVQEWPTFCLEPRFSSESAHKPGSCRVRCWMFQLWFLPWPNAVLANTNTHSLSALEHLINESEPWTTAKWAAASR